MFDLILVGASVRAVAFSAIRAGFRPWCVDLFADVDLQKVTHVVKCPFEQYPDGLLPLVESGPDVPVIYTGGLENHPELLDRLAQLRPLWGNHSETIRKVRDPFLLHNLLTTAGVAVPEVRSGTGPVPTEGKWLRKPLRGSGGIGIQPVTSEEAEPPSDQFYFQRFVDGVPHSSIFLATDSRCHLLGSTRQLIGESWLKAKPFRYCGSIGPVALSLAFRDRLIHPGEQLTSICQLRGIFGVDWLLTANEVPVVLEVNPRYTASVEVLEYTTGIQTLKWHCDIFLGRDVSSIRIPVEKFRLSKTILFTDEPMIFPTQGPWDETLRETFNVDRPPAFADIPAPGTMIEAGFPVMTLFRESG
jgi:predicted ATP-grasp superfamily ATP-dependent carboligase